MTELASRFGCERVSIGFERRGGIEVFVISHTAQFSEQMNLVRLLGEAMDEAVDQRAYINYPPDPDEPLAVRAHEDLARKHRATAILTIPLFVRDRFIGALTFERVGEGARFSPRDIGVLDYVAACLSPILSDKRDLDRLLIAKIWNSLEYQLKPIFGPSHIGRKLVLLALVGFVGFAYFAKTEYRIAADARIEGSVQRTIAAPFDGFIRDVSARPGDVVEKDVRLVSLDDRDLVLERLKWATEREKQQREYDRALGERNRSEVRIITTRIEQADAQIELIGEKLERTSLYAPFSGVVISGDLSQRIGDAVRKGEALMEVAPLESYRVILGVDETQIDDIEPEQTGELVMASLPDTAFPIRVTKIIPASHVADGRTVFTVEATLTENPERLRPGMKGVAKVAVDERRTLWIWTRPFLHWLRLFIWRWVP
jgi:multidrug resistance efflux pump